MVENTSDLEDLEVGEVVFLGIIFVIAPLQSFKSFYGETYKSTMSLTSTAKKQESEKKKKKKNRKRASLNGSPKSNTSSISLEESL